MIDSGKRNIIDVLVNAIDYEAAVEHVIPAAKQKEHMVVSALAVHGVTSGVLDDRYLLNI